MSETVSDREREILRHSVGAYSNVPAEVIGYRNRFWANRESQDFETLVELERRGLVRGCWLASDVCGSRPPDLARFKVTEAGCRAAGLDAEQTRRALAP